MQLVVHGDGKTGRNPAESVGIPREWKIILRGFRRIATKCRGGLGAMEKSMNLLQERIEAAFDFYGALEMNIHRKIHSHAKPCFDLTDAEGRIYGRLTDLLLSLHTSL